MRRLAAVIVLAGLILGLNYYVANHLPANTYLNSDNFGLKNRNEILLYLATHKNPTLKIEVEKRIYQFEYADLGIIFDLNATYADLVASGDGLRNFWSGFASSRTIVPKLIFTQDYFDKLESMQFDFSTSKDEVRVDEKKKNLVYQNNQDIFVIDSESLRKEITDQFGKKNILRPRIHRVFNNSGRLKVEDYNRKIKNVLDVPVSLYYENGTQAIAEIPKNDLQALIIINYEPQSELLSIGVSDEILISKINDLNRRLNLSADLELDRTDLKTKLISLINSRFNGVPVDYVYARLVESPNTNGEEAAKYIEIDISQQKMYLWENGQNIAIHRVSSGLYYPTPPGRYQILNKANNAYSSIYHVWMPYWMAFSLDRKVNAYLGIHELPYWIDSGGQEIRRPRDFIGSPHTGGCVSLDVGEAEKVYAWAQVGMPVIIFE